MIAVIADDFTGAAELAGVSLRYGLTVDLYLREVQATTADVLIICTDSRSLNLEDAKRVTAAAIGNILTLQPTFIYKKIDSVLRGYVMEEINIQVKLCGVEKVLIIPANPSLGRTISSGEYFVDGKPITETGFSADPEFPIRSSMVKRMIGDNAVFVLKNPDSLPVSGFVIGEALSGGDIARWVNVAGNGWMLVGAADFYSAILDKEFSTIPQAPVKMQSPHLYVSGTAYSERKQFIKKLNEDQDCVAYMPGRIDDEWISKACAQVRNEKRLLIAIHESNDDAALLRSSMAKATREIVEKENIKEVFIEGGSTAAAVLREMGIKRLTPVNELQRGVVRMKTGDLFITVKPGSYELPPEIKDLYN